MATKRAKQQPDEPMPGDDLDLVSLMRRFSTEDEPLTLDTLTPPTNLVGVLMHVANALRSHGIDDQRKRYRETVKLILARYCDEKAAAETPSRQLALQVYPGLDPGFRVRVDAIYMAAASRYHRAKTLFEPSKTSALSDDALKDVVRAIQGIRVRDASNEIMQTVFMSFVPSVLDKDNLDQYFTPMTLIRAMVEMVHIGPNDIVADPAMGTADFLTAAMEYRIARGDDDADQRVRGADCQADAYELAIINMILNRDGQANLVRADTIEDHLRWNGDVAVALCNPPFGSRTVERRPAVLQHYDLGHVWERSSEDGRWQMTDRIQDKQQLGILFIERCYKLLTDDGGRMAIILPEGFLATESHGYVRQWILDHLKVLSVVELPRRIFLKSDADLRSNILVGMKSSAVELEQARQQDYPIHAGMVRRIGYKLGKGFSPVPLRDRETGMELRDDTNALRLASDFDAVTSTFEAFWEAMKEGGPEVWDGARYSDVARHPDLDLKPRRLMPKALANVRSLRSSKARRLGDVAVVVDERLDILDAIGPAELRRLVAGQNVRAVEGLVTPDAPRRCWAIAGAKGSAMHLLAAMDIVVGRVRPERRNVGLFIEEVQDVLAHPDGVCVVRADPDKQGVYPIEWVFAALRSEACRLQLWTVAGGTSYGKIDRDQLAGVLLPSMAREDRIAVAETVRGWVKHVRESTTQWNQIGSEEDRIPILNSPLIGLVDSEEGDDENGDEEGDE